MAYPTPYNRQNSFTLLAQENPSTPYTGSQLDGEFNAVKLTIDSVIERLRRLQRSDGRLENGVVSVDSLGFSFALGIDPPVAWSSGAAYTSRSTVFSGDILYRANVAHTSSALFATDAAKWDELADLSDMLAGGIGTSSLQDGAVTASKLGAGAVTAPKMATNAVAAGNIQANAITTPKIFDANVTYAKIQNVSANKVLGSIAGGAPEEIAMTATGRGVAAAASQAAFTALIAAGTETLPGILELATTAEATAGTDTARAVTAAGVRAAALECLFVPVTRETTPVSAGTSKRVFRMPYAFTVTAMRASLATAQTSGTVVTVDINEAGNTILSTKLTIDNTEKTSTTAATAAVVSDGSLADASEITIDVDAIGDGTAKGLTVYIIGRRT